jgi:DNA topoisomerase-1
VKSGRYGPYVSHDGINATLTSDMTPETISLEQATGLLEARASRVGSQKAGNGKIVARPRSTARKMKPKPTTAAKPKAARAARKGTPRKAKVR